MQSGRWRGRPLSPCKSGMASTSESACCESFRLAPVSWMARGTPRPSQIRWRLLPSLARSVGFGPVCSPQKLPGSNYRPRRPATNQSPRSAPASPAKRSGSVARCLPLASHVTAASRSCLNHSQVPVATSPTVCRCGARTECPTDKRGLVSGVCHP